MRLKGIVSYNGSSFFGYQIQKNEEERSIQDEIQKIFSRLFNQEIKIVSSGRTDRGVHALNQCFHFDVDKEEIDLSKIKYAFNRLVDKNIYLKSLEEVSSDFHARFSVKNKTYRYIINLGEFNPFVDNLIYNFNKELDIALMEECSKEFIGEKNFQNFCCNDEDFVRTINSIYLTKKQDYLLIDINGNGFRRYMVRMIVGTLIEVGLHRLTINEVKTLFDGNFSRVSFKAPSSGLYLLDINY